MYIITPKDHMSHDLSYFSGPKTSGAETEIQTFTILAGKEHTPGLEILIDYHINSNNHPCLNKCPLPLFHQPYNGEQHEFLFPSALPNGVHYSRKEFAPPFPLTLKGVVRWCDGPG